VEKTQLRFIFFLGKGAAGKDTQADFLKTKVPDTIAISTGEIYRGAKNSVGEFAKYHSTLEPYIKNVDAGGYIPDEPIVNITKAVILENIEAGKRVFLFTGFPRTVIQLNLVDQMVRDMSGDYEITDSYVYYPVSDEVVRERSEKRRQLAFAKGEIPREDDQPESVNRKLETFYKLTKPLIQRLCIEDRLIVVNGERTVSEVEAETSLKISRERV